MHSAYAGRYQLQVKRLDGSIKYESDWFDNLITNAGLDSYGSVYANTFRAWLGTGAAVAEVDTSMSAVATTTSYTAATSYQQVTAPPWEKTRYIFTFPVGAYVGTISDVGVGWGTGVASFTPLYSHALLPTAITLGAIDQVILTYDHYFVGPSAYQTHQFELNGIVTSVTGKFHIGGTFQAFPSRLGYRYCYFNGYAHAYTGAVMSPISNFSGYTSLTKDFELTQNSYTVNNYVNGSFIRSYTLIIKAEQGDLTNINGLAIPALASIGTWSGFLCVIDPTFTKTNLQRLTLSGEWSWARTIVPE